MYKIRLSDGAEYPVRFCSARGGLLTMVILTADSFLDVAEVFTEQAASVTFLYDSSQEVFEGYTELVMINGSTPGAYTVTLRKE